MSRLKKQKQRLYAETRPGTEAFRPQKRSAALYGIFAQVPAFVGRVLNRIFERYMLRHRALNQKTLRRKVSDHKTMHPKTGQDIQHENNLFTGWLALSMLGFFMSPIFILVGPLSVWICFKYRKITAARKKDRETTEELPHLIELFRISSSSGLTTRLGMASILNRTDSRMFPRLYPVLLYAQQRINYGDPVNAVFQSLPQLFGMQLRILVKPFLESEQYGTDLSSSLRQASQEAWQKYRLETETAARKISVKMIFPLVVCILPAFGFLTVIPVLISSLESLNLL